MAGLAVLGTTVTTTVTGNPRELVPPVPRARGCVGRGGSEERGGGASFVLSPGAARKRHCRPQALLLARVREAVKQAAQQGGSVEVGACRSGCKGDYG